MEGCMSGTVEVAGEGDIACRAEMAEGEGGWRAEEEESDWG